MEIRELFDELEACISRYDLLTHPFYQAWSRGELSRDELRHYAEDYYFHVDSFPSYLAEFARRLSPSELRRRVLMNFADEIGGGNMGPSHSDLWLDFARAMGANLPFPRNTPSFRVRALVAFFHRVAKTGTAAQALTAFYVYESQVPRIAREKLRGLREYYGADDSVCRYFLLHMTADVEHARVWRTQLEALLLSNPGAADSVLRTAEATGAKLWASLPYSSVKRRVYGDPRGRRRNQICDSWRRIPKCVVYPVTL